jgi:hypothetical protein
MSVRRIAEPAVIMDAEERFEGFENLMPFKVHNILLVSSLYDSFILREDGRLNELLIDQSLDLNLQQIPRSGCPFGRVAPGPRSLGRVIWITAAVPWNVETLN